MEQHIHVAKLNGSKNTQFFPSPALTDQLFSSSTTPDFPHNTPKKKRKKTLYILTAATTPSISRIQPPKILPMPPSAPPRKSAATYHLSDAAAAAAKPIINFPTAAADRETLFEPASPPAAHPPPHSSAARRSRVLRRSATGSFRIPPRSHPRARRRELSQGKRLFSADFPGPPSLRPTEPALLQRVAQLVPLTPRQPGGSEISASRPQRST